MQTIGITGGTGFVGQQLKRLLLESGYKVIIFTTHQPKDAGEQNVAYARWDPYKQTMDRYALAEVDGVVHLAGAGVADKRWTAARKQEIEDSRVKGSAFLVSQLKEHGTRCKTLVAASATGFYGPDRGGEPFKESDAPYSDFLGNTCKLWEAETHKAESFLRTVILRLGIVLGKEHGAMAEFIAPMRFGIRPILGNGRQVVSWISVTDLARLILYALQHQEMNGTFNAVTPRPITHREMMNTVGRHASAFNIPAPVPAFVLKVMLGEMSGELLKSCTVSAQKTLASGFKFDTPELEGAVKQILGR